MSASEKPNSKTTPFGVLKHNLIISLLMVLIGFCAFPGSKLTHKIVQKTIFSLYREYLTVTSTVCVLTLVLSYLYLRATYSYWSTRNVPGPRPSLVVGNTLQRLGITVHILEYYEDLYYNQNGKDFCGFYDFIKPGLVVGNPELIRSITMKNFDHFANRRVFPMAKINPIADDMLSNATGEKWHRIRTAISPVFTSYKLKQLYNLICSQGDQFTELLKTRGKNGQELEMRELCGQFTMDIITSCAFGIDCEAMNSDRAMFHETASKIFVLTPIRAIKMIILLIVPFVANLIQFLGIEFTSEEFHFLRKAITQTLRIREQKGIRRGDFLDLMKDTNKLSETTMIAQAVMFLIAGHGNTATTLSFTLHLLAMNPDVQEQLRKEVIGARNANGDVEYDILRKLPYLDAVVKESLRLYPADPTMERICTQDYQLPGTKLFIRKGQSVIIPIWSIHHDATYWPDPETFKPERFLRVPEKDLPPYLPFGCGPRQCIGMKFVQLVVKVALQKILFDFKITPSPNTLHPPPLSPRCFLSTIPIHGLSLRVIPLNDQEK